MPGFEGRLGLGPGGPELASLPIQVYLMVMSITKACSPEWMRNGARDSVRDKDTPDTV